MRSFSKPSKTLFRLLFLAPLSPSEIIAKVKPSAAMASIYRSVAAARSLSRLIGPSATRSFGAAAAVQLDYESDEENERDRRRHGLVGLADACGEAVGRGVQWVFMGSPGVQKRVYASRISKLLDVPYISMGSLVREELNPRSSLYKQIANAVNEGKLVPEDIIFGLLSRRLEDGYYRGETGFILDGIPRSKIQAEILDQIADIDLVVNFKCMEDCLVKHSGCNICSFCGKSFEATSSTSTSINPCLATRARHSQLKSSPATDMEESRKEKLRNSAEQSKVLEDYYRKQGKLLDFEVAGGPGETWRGLLAALHLQHIDALNSSQKLTA